MDSKCNVTTAADCQQELFQSETKKQLTGTPGQGNPKGERDSKQETCTSDQGKEQQGVHDKGCEVYVTRIPRNLQEKDLVEIFSEQGEITDFRLMMEPNGMNRGYAYIRYQNLQDAKKAIKRLNNYEIYPNRYLVVTKSVDNRRLWVNGIPKSKSTHEIRKEMERLTIGVTDIILYPSQTDKSKSRGYMFVEYESHKAAAMARRKLSQGSVCMCGQEIGQVDWAEPEHEVDDETMANVKVLFVRNLMMSTTEDTLRSLFNTYSAGGTNNSNVCEVERVKKTKDFAFVHFCSRAGAERALARATANPTIDGAVVEVLWSKPVDKKLYNTRKTLTKAFTQAACVSGSGGGGVVPLSEAAMLAASVGASSCAAVDSRGSPNGGSLLVGSGGNSGGIGSSTCPSLLPPLPPLSPRRRGAAGIRGLGAPGTAPSKQLVQRFFNSAAAAAAMAASHAAVGVHNSAASAIANSGKMGLMTGGGMVATHFRSSVEILAEVCQANHWGQPVYSLETAVTPDSVKMFVCKISIGQLPVPPGLNVFQGYFYKASPDEARLDAAQTVLGILNTMFCYSHAASLPQVYPFSAATSLQGVPLTYASGPAPAHHAGHSVSTPITSGTAGLACTSASTGVTSGPGTATPPSVRVVYPATHADAYSAAQYASVLSSMCAMNVSG